jgi:hypothetical protein
LNKTIRLLLTISLLLLAAGGLCYYYGHQQNLLNPVDTNALQVSAGDKWLFAGAAGIAVASLFSIGMSLVPGPH